MINVCKSFLNHKIHLQWIRYIFVQSIHLPRRQLFLNRNIRKFKLRNTLTKTSVCDEPSSPEASKGLNEISTSTNALSPLKPTPTSEAGDVDELQNIEESSPTEKVTGVIAEMNPSTRYLQKI